MAEPRKPLVLRDMTVTREEATVLNAAVLTYSINFRDKQRDAASVEAIDSLVRKADALIDKFPKVQPPVHTARGSS